jgi:Phage integrase family
MPTTSRGFIPKAYIRTIRSAEIGIPDPRKTFHSLRHTFKTALDRAGVPRSMQDDLCGHEDNSAGAGYVHGESVEAMKEAIEKLRFDGFPLASYASLQSRLFIFVQFNLQELLTAPLKAKESKFLSRKR